MQHSLEQCFNSFMAKNIGRSNCYACAYFRPCTLWLYQMPVSLIFKGNDVIDSVSGEILNEIGEEE